MSSPMPVPDGEGLVELDDHILGELAKGRWSPDHGLIERRPSIGVVFGAGGVLGNAYLSGAIAALNRMTGFEPRTASVLVGTSAGSVHAALFGAGMPAAFGLWRSRGGTLPVSVFDELAAEDDLGEEQTLRDIFTPARGLPRPGPASVSLGVKALLRPWAYRTEIGLSAWLPEGVLSNTAIGHALRRIVPSGWAPHPRTWVVTVNLRTGARVAFGRPDAPQAHLDHAVRASCAIPGLYRPVRIGRDRYIDGGMHSPSNADLVADLDLDLVVVINPMSSLEGHAAAGFVDRYIYPLRRFAGRRLDAELRTLRERGQRTLVIQPSARDLSVFSRNLMDSKPRRAVAEIAVETTAETLAQRDAADAVQILRQAAAASSASA